MEKTIKLTITDQTGHTEVDLNIEEAVVRIVDECKKYGKFLYVDDEPHNFTHNFSKEDISDLSALLKNSEEALLTGTLVGGIFRDSKGRFATRPVRRSKARKASRSTNYRNRTSVTTDGFITNSPLSTVLTGKNRPHIAISLTKSHGKEKIKVFFSNYNGSRKKLRRHVVPVVAAIVEGLKKS